MRFFSYESKFSQLVLKISYACCLNLLWFVCSLPIFTAGAATTALYYASLKIIRDEESHVVAMFFRSFRENFRQATQIWLILLGVGLFLGADGYILYHLRLTSTGTLAVIWTLVLVLKNAFLIGTHYLFATILVFAVHFAMFFAVVRIFTPLIIFGEGLCAMVSAWLLNSILISVSYVPSDDDDGEDSP